MTAAPYRPIRVAARALIVIDQRLLLVNAYADPAKQLLCAPGGGGEPGEALTETLFREVYEETGLSIQPGALAGVSEFHDPDEGFHQLDLFFHAKALDALPEDWADPADIVERRLLVTRDDLAHHPHKPDHLATMAFDHAPPSYHGLERKV